MNKTETVLCATFWTAAALLPSCQEKTGQEGRPQSPVAPPNGSSAPKDASSAPRATAAVPRTAFQDSLSALNVPRDPFVANDGQIPSKDQYSGPLFTLSHDWPTSVTPLKDPPWIKAIGDAPINTKNAAAYVEALKRYVTHNARALILDYAHWDAQKAGWYNEPWLGSQREAIHGTYEAGQFLPETFPGTGLRATFDTTVLTYYDARAAYTISKLWGASAMTPGITTANAQFAEGAVVVKAALFTNDDPTGPSDWWDAVKGAAQWLLFLSLPEGVNPLPPHRVVTGYVMQFDIIVKDSKSAPKTGWVFSTLVYDASATGDAWEKMVPLGAMWGNDPESNSSLIPPPPLRENWINPKAPKYSTETLGWGGRLSGPNDGAQNAIVVDGKPIPNAADSSCMSCHGPSEWNVSTNKQASFLLPSFPNPAPPPPFKTCPDGNPNDPPAICSPAPGSADWMRWFQDRPGTAPQDPGSVALDYDEVFAFKALPLWWKATGPADQPPPFLFTHGGRNPAAGGQRFNQYTGAPLPNHGAPAPAQSGGQVPPK